MSENCEGPGERRIRKESIRGLFIWDECHQPTTVHIIQPHLLLLLHIA